MTLTAIILILLSTCLHAGWNLIAKSSKPSPMFFLVLTIVTSVILTPVLLMNLGGLNGMSAKFWYLLAATGFSQALYYTGLAQSYRYGDISLVYPLARALPVLIVPMVCNGIGIGKPLSYQAIAGMILIGAGCLIMPVKEFKNWHIRDYWGKALIWVIPAAIGTTAYTIIDSELMKFLAVKAFNVPANTIYSCLISLSILPWLAGLVSFTGRWHDINNYKGRKLLRPAGAAVACSLAYMLVLASMNYVTNVSYVAGFRQLSIPLGVIMGVVILKEKFYLPRIIGCIIIAAGLILTAVY